MFPDPLSIAQQFAQALDQEDYKTAAVLISPSCSYQLDKDTIIGSEAIIASYRESGDWAKANLDHIEYESRVEMDNEGRAVITFVDHLQHEGESLTHTCRQVLTISPIDPPEGGTPSDPLFIITNIKHIDLPGEPDAVQEFFNRHGIER